MINGCIKICWYLSFGKHNSSQTHLLSEYLLLTNDQFSSNVKKWTYFWKEWSQAIKNGLFATMWFEKGPFSHSSI